MAKNRNIAFLVFFGGAAFLTLVFFALYVVLILMTERDVSFGDSVAVVDITGEIYYNRGKVAEIESYRDDDNVKAVLLFINSPGGGVSASQALYHAVASCKDRKPVVAFMGAVAASGGYYLACGADTIMAHEGTITGSIGVIATFLRTEELFQKIGLDVTVIKSGQYKDVGSPHREMTESEREYMSELLDGAYAQFLRAVSDGRDLDLERVRELAEGRLYSGEEAYEVGLIDRIGTYEEALMLAASMGGIEGKPKVVKKRRKRSFWELLLGQAGANLPLQRAERIRLQYIIP